MKLPLMAARSDDGMWRRFADVAIDHALAAGEELVVRGARAVAGDDVESRRLPGLVILPEHASADDVAEEVLGAFENHGAVPPYWLDPYAAATSAILQRFGYTGGRSQLLRLRSATSGAENPPGVLIVSARAARSAYSAWCEARAADDVSAVLLPRHVDDPQYEAFVALLNGQAVAAAGLQIRGQTGLVCDVSVRPDVRLRGLASLLLTRVSDLAARAQLSEIYAVIDPSREAAVRTSERAGFAVVQEFTTWVPPTRELNP